MNEQMSVVVFDDDIEIIQSKTVFLDIIVY